MNATTKAFYVLVALVAIVAIVIVAAAILFRKQVFPAKVYDSQSCKVVNIPDLQEETYLVQGSAVADNLTIGFYCSDQVGSVRYKKIPANEVNLIPTDSGSTERQFTQTFSWCPQATKYTQSLLENYVRCKPTIVEQRLEVPLDWIQ